MMFWRGKRKYTGYDYTSKGRREGTTKLINWILFLNNGKFRNLGSWTVRDARGKPGKRSVHATGRAFDLGFKNYEDAVTLCNFLTRHWEAFGIEAIIDYYPAPFGRGWRCDRLRWIDYKKHTVAGAPRGKWIHVELSNEVADDAAYIDAVMACLLTPSKGKYPF